MRGWGDPETGHETNTDECPFREPGPDGRTWRLVCEDFTLKTMTKTTLRAVWTVGLLGLATACGGEDTAGKTQVSGRITDAQGTQAQSVGAAQTGGSGTVAATATVRVSTVGGNGALTTAAEGSVAADGRYTLDLASASGQFVIQAVDASGKVLASAMLEAAAEGQTTAAPPMDSETSLEASVYLRARADTASSETVNMVDVRERINARMAEAAQQGAASGAAFEARVKALADGVRAAQRTEVEVYSRAGVQTSQAALFQSELAASAALNASLDAGANAEQAYEKFYADLRASAEKAGATAQKQADSERAAGASFRATVDIRLSADAAPLLDAALRQSAALEARASGAALTATLEAAGAADSVKQQGATASTKLVADARAATSASASAQAFSSFQTSVTGGASVQSSVLGQYLGVTLANELVLKGALSTTAQATATLDAALDAAVKAAVTASSVDVALLASQTAAAYQTYTSAVRAQATVLSAAFGAKASTGVEVMLVSQGALSLE